MGDIRDRLTGRPGRLALSVVAAAILASGATWQVFARAAAPVADPAVEVQSQTPTVTRTLPNGRESYADIVKVVAPAVVTIRTEASARVRPTGAPDQLPDDLFRRFFGDQFEPFGGPGLSPEPGRRMPMPRRGLGSGVIMSSDGYILTNHHVVDNADGIRVELTDGRRFDAKVVGSDAPSDLALLKIDVRSLPVLALGDSERVEVGDVVLAVGNPLGLGQTVTMGIVSAKGRHTGEGFEEFLQTDAPINQGNSGGALVNLKGELVGINAQIASMTGGNIGIGFAIPANMARRVMDDLKTSGKVRRAALGVTIQSVDSDMAESLNLKEVRGVIVSSVERGSAAEKAGIKKGDVIISFAGQPVRDLNSLRNRVAESEPGSKHPVAIVRDGREQTLSITLDEREATRTAASADSPSNSSAASTLGVRVSPLTAERARRERLPEGARGLVIEGVDSNSRAASAGLQVGDVITEANRRPVESVDDLRAAVKQSASRPVLLLVMRDGRELFMTVRHS